MKKRVFAAVLSCCMLLTVCSGCGKKTIRRNEGTLNESVTSMLDKAAENTASSPAAETVDRTAEFQAVMDAVSVDSRYASCKRYVMVNDYDGDGKQEAFGFFGEASPMNGYPRWERLHIYYISSEGAVTVLCDPEQEFSEDDMLCGTPANQDALDPTDFSASYLTSGNQTFALFEVGYPYSEYFTMAWTVYGGEPVCSYAEAGLRPAAEGWYVADGYDEQLVYRVREGELMEVGTGASDALAAQNGMTGLRSPEQAWEKNKSGILQELADLYGLNTAGALEYFIPADYDGDGKQEAFGILAGDQTDWGFSDWARIYYISSDGFIFCAQSSRADGTQLYGYLPGSDGYAADPQSCLLTAGNQKFLRWELSAGGSGSVTSILGVKDGAPYHPQISEMYQDVRQQGGKYYGTTSDFSRDFHDYIDHELVFDPAQGEFSEK